MSMTLARICGGSMFLIGDEMDAVLKSLIDSAIEALPEDERPVAESERDGIRANLIHQVHELGHLPESISLFRNATASEDA